MRWSKLQQGGEVPQPRSSHSITSLGDGFLAVWGGEHAPRVPLPTELYLYDLKTSTWKVACGAAGAPTERVAHAAAAINGTLYIHGGRTEVAEESTLGDLHAFDFATATWRQLAPSGPTPAARNYHAAITSGTSFYILGGCTKAGRVADLWRYDTVTGTWEEQPSSIAIKGRGGPGFLATDDALWVIGGFTGSEAADIHRFDLRTKQWEEVAVASSGLVAPFTGRSVFARAAHACDSAACDHSGHIILFGGEVDPSELGHAGAGHFTDTVYCMDPVTKEWHGVHAAAGEGPGPLGWMASTSVPEGMVVHGGINKNNERQGGMFLLDVHS